MEDDWKKIETDVWTPEKAGDDIIGIYIGVQKDVGENKSKLYSVEVSEGKTLNVWGSTVLDRKMMSVGIGQRVRIVYLGKVKPEGGREYKDYDVYSQNVDDIPVQKVN